VLEPALQSKGLFVYRKEAQGLLDKNKKKEPTKEEKGKDKSK